MERLREIAQTGLTGLFIVVVVVVGVGFALFMGPVKERGNIMEKEGQIVDTYVKRIGEADIFFAAIRLQGGETIVFENRDAVLWWKFNSSDVQQKLVAAKESGITVKLTLTGWRIPEFSWFQNVIRVE